MFRALYNWMLSRDNPRLRPRVLRASDCPRSPPPSSVYSPPGCRRVTAARIDRSNVASEGTLPFERDASWARSRLSARTTVAEPATARLVPTGHVVFWHRPDLRRGVGRPHDHRCPGLPTLEPGGVWPRSGSPIEYSCSAAAATSWGDPEQPSPLPGRASARPTGSPNALSSVVRRAAPSPSRR